MAQTVKCLPAVLETRVRSLGWEDLLEKETATQPGESHGRTEEPGRLPVFLLGEFQGQTSLVNYSPWGCKESDMTEQLHFMYIINANLLL